MKERFFIFTLVMLVILVLIDLYAYKGVKLITSTSSDNTKSLVSKIYWGISFGVILWLLVLTFFLRSYFNPRNYSYFFYTFGVIILTLLPKLVFIVFHLVEDLSFLAFWGTKRVISSAEEADKISRYQFLTQIGAYAAAVPFISIAYGILKGRFDFRVENVEVVSDKIPQAFHGLRIAQISDVHIGSFFDNPEPVLKGLKLLQEQKPDIIFFTGDLVNNYADEMNGFVVLFKNLHAPLGKFSILGNHDYGDYVEWETEQAKKENFYKMVSTHHQMGFKLMLNESLKIEKDGESIELIGIENWGAGGFAKYGDLPKALQGVTSESFKILMSHDPSHWDAQVLGKTNIDLALAGHTHGMQFGVNIGGIKWSPVKYKYPRWSGLYAEGKQQLYVNRGFGYIGFPGRVGILPEITILNLKRA